MIQSIERALNILELLSRNRIPLSVMDIANELKLNRTTTYGILNTLIEMDYVVPADIPGKFTVSGKMYNLSFSYPNRLAVVRHAMPYLQDLVDQFGVTAHLGALSLNNEVLLLKAVFPQNMQDITGSGLFPLHATGLGKVILAYLPDEKADKLIMNRRLKGYTEKTITDPAVLISELSKIRQQMYAADREEYIEGISCVSFPVFGERNSVIAAFSLSGLKHLIENRTDEIITFGLHHAKLLSRELGCTLFD